MTHVPYLIELFADPFQLNKKVNKIRSLGAGAQE